MDSVTTAEDLREIPVAWAFLVRTNRSGSNVVGEDLGQINKIGSNESVGPYRISPGL